LAVVALEEVLTTVSEAASRPAASAADMEAASAVTEVEAAAVDTEAAGKFNYVEFK
jgi:hypothetical protein